MKVEITQFMRPNGLKKIHEIEISDECEEKYKEILACNARLTAEQLMNGVVSQAIECTDFDYDLELTPGNDFEQNKKLLKH